MKHHFKNHLKTLLKISAGAAAVMLAINKFIESSALFRHLLKTDDGDFYNWNHGKIYYTKKGNGSPLLLVHDLYPTSSQEEWKKIISVLARKYTVFAVDLPGCGRSEKPNIVYSNYYYVQMLSDFIRDVIKEKTSVISTGKSGSFTVMAAKMYPNQFKDLYLVNPESFGKLSVLPNNCSKVIKALFRCPILGTFLYYLLTSSNQIDYDFREKAFYNPFCVTKELINVYYEAAHISNAGGRYLFASLKGNYVNNNIEPAFSKLENTIYLIFGNKTENAENIAISYKKANPATEYFFIEKTKMLPQIEAPEKFLQILR